MNRSLLVFLSASLMVFNACSGSNGKGGSGGSSTESLSIDENGNCTSEFVSDYNSVVIEGQSLRSALTYGRYSEYSNVQSQAQKMSNACKKFFDSHSDVSCKAEVNYEVKTVSSADHNAACEIARKLAAGEINSDSDKNNANNVLANTANASGINSNTGDQRELAKIAASKIEAKILNKDSVRYLLTYDDYVAYNGGVSSMNLIKNKVSEDISASRSAVICQVLNNKKAINNTIDELKNFVKAEILDEESRTDSVTSRSVAIKFNDGTFITCVKIPNSPITVGEVQSAFRDIIEFRVAE